MDWKQNARTAPGRNFFRDRGSKPGLVVHSAEPLRYVRHLLPLTVYGCIVDKIGQYYKSLKEGETLYGRSTPKDKLPLFFNDLINYIL